MCLYAVALVVIISEVDQLQCQICPQALQSCSVHASNVEHSALEAEHMCCVDILDRFQNEDCEETSYTVLPA